MHNIDNHEIEIETEFDYNWQVDQLTPEGKVVPAEQGRRPSEERTNTIYAVVCGLGVACIVALIYLKSIVIS